MKAGARELLALVLLGTAMLLGTAARWLPEDSRGRVSAAHADAGRGATFARSDEADPPAPVPASALSEAGFRERANEVLYSLPTLEDLRGLPPEEAHFTPEVLLEAGARLGEISLELERNPGLAEAGRQFYRTCAERADLPASIRGLCYSHYEGPPFEVPDEVAEVADELLE